MDTIVRYIDELMEKVLQTDLSGILKKFSRASNQNGIISMDA